MADAIGVVAIFGFLSICVVSCTVISVTDTRKADQSTNYVLCVQNGGDWDGFWRSCKQPAPTKQLAGE